MIPIQMACVVNGCPFKCDWSTKGIDQYNEMQYHLDTVHFKNRKKDNMASILEREWLVLDEYMRFIMESDDKEQVQVAKQRARGFAECLAMGLDKPIDFPDTDSVIRHTVKRYKAYKAGEILPATPGFLYSGKSMEDLAGDLGYAYGADYEKMEAEIADVASRPKPTAGRKEKFPEPQRSNILKALDNGMEPDELASLYGCTPEEIAALKE